MATNAILKRMTKTRRIKEYPFGGGIKTGVLKDNHLYLLKSDGKFVFGYWIVFCPSGKRYNRSLSVEKNIERGNWLSSGFFDQKRKRGESNEAFQRRAKEVWGEKIWDLPEQPGK